MNIQKALLILFSLAWFSAMKAQDTLPLRDTTRIADAIILNDSAKQVIMDTLPAGIDAVKGDTIAKKKHDPRKATIRSAIIPGWGQIYNKKIWKVPIVYAAIGVPVGTFIYNRNWYTKTRDAAKMIASGDTADYKLKVDPQLWIFFSTPNSEGALLNYRNDFRRNMDYSVLITLLMWGLNVVDATVDAHLRDFDVSEDLSLRVKPTLNYFTMTPGISVTMTIGKRKPKEYKPVLIP